MNNMIGNTKKKEEKEKFVCMVKSENFLDAIFVVFAHVCTGI